jgi:Glycoside hydrolase 97.
MKRIALISALILTFASFAQAKETSYKIESPDGRTTVVATIGNETYFTVYHGKEQIIASSIISMTVGDQLLGQGCTVKSAKKSSVDNVIKSPFYKASSVRERYNQVDILLKEGFGIIFRVYDEGFAYRFYNCSLKKGDKIMDEVLNLRFDKDYKAWFPYATGTDNPFKTSFENRYDETTITGLKDGKYAFSPILLGLDSGVRIGITEADLEDYPGMFFVKDDSEGIPALKSAFAHVPEKVKVTPTRCQEIVESYTDVLAEIKAASSKKDPRFFPWRAFIIADNDAELLSNNLVWLLSSPSRINDTSWIKPGKVAWDWWNDWGISGVDFKAGINTETYKHYIDFASAKRYRICRARRGMVAFKRWRHHEGDT